TEWSLLPEKPDLPDRYQFQFFFQSISSYRKHKRKQVQGVGHPRRRRVQRDWLAVLPYIWLKRKHIYLPEVGSHADDFVRSPKKKPALRSSNFFVRLPALPASASRAC